MLPDENPNEIIVKLHHDLGEKSEEEGSLMTLNIGG